jgi:GAF domain-containing protein
MLVAIARDEAHLTWLRAIGFQSAMAVPLIVRAKPIGALLFLSMDPGRRYSCEDLELAEEIGRRAALAIDNAHLFRTMNRAEQLSRFLADAANTLSASLNEDELVGRVTSLAVPAVADFAMAYLWKEDESVRYVASAHRDPSRKALLEEAARLYRRDPNNPRATVSRARRTARPVLVEHVTAEFLDSLELEPRLRELARELAPVSWLTVPLVAQGKTLGAIVLASDRTEHKFGAEDVTFAERFAHSAALAVQNARLFRTVEDALRARDEVLGIVSHDLRNPLSAIKMKSELLLEVPLDEAERKRHLNTMLRATGRMDRLIRICWTLYGSSREAVIIEQQRACPSTFIREACESFALEARENACGSNGPCPTICRTSS